MSVTRPAPLFGISIDPAFADPHEPLRRALLADANGLDLLTLMDHPYNRKLFETWTLLTVLAANTKRVHVGTNVLNLPLRPPAMLAKMAATLDVLSGGRLELGLGAGALWDGVAAYGGPRRTPGEAVTALREAILILRGMWHNSGGKFSFQGECYQVVGARPGPAPAHPVRIWLGALGPRMLDITGRLADGVLVSHNWVGPDRLADINRRIDEGILQAGRSPFAVRRGYNLMGTIAVSSASASGAELGPEYMQGNVAYWIERILQFFHEYRMDTFNFWPVAGDQYAQLEIFAQEVVPAVKEALA